MSNCWQVCSSKIKLQDLVGSVFSRDFLGADVVMLFQMTVEVERKFMFSAETLETLENIGGKRLVHIARTGPPMNVSTNCCATSRIIYFKLTVAALLATDWFAFMLILSAVCVDQRQFHDQYFDTPEFNLTLRDMWLRKRKGCWELKCATANGAEEPSEERPADAALCTHYKEINSLSEIYQRVKEVIKVACEDGEVETTPSQEDCSWLSKLNLACFAEFTTTRRSFTLWEEGVKIDLDQADFGHHVGEIEVLIPEGGDVQLAQEKIRNAAKKLGKF